MKKRLAILLLAIGLIVGIGFVGPAREPLTCPTDYPPICGLELDSQIGGPCPSFFIADVGLMPRQFFHVGIGGSFGNIENQCLVGGYFKIGDLVFDIFKLEAKLLFDDLCCPTSWYGDCKLKVPLLVCLPCDNVALPLYGGFQYSESNLGGNCSFNYSREFAWLIGASDRYAGCCSTGEIWLELHFSKYGYLTGLEFGASLGFY